jgi:hypothetical protein
MKVLVIFSLLFSLTVANVIPKASANMAPRQDDENTCGVVTDESVSLATPIIADESCRNLHTQGKQMKYYKIFEGYGCLFFANDKCSKQPVDEWTGWVFGPASGEFTKRDTTHYLCGKAQNPFNPPKI